MGAFRTNNVVLWVVLGDSVIDGETLLNPLKVVGCPSCRGPGRPALREIACRLMEADASSLLDVCLPRLFFQPKG